MSTNKYADEYRIREKIREDVAHLPAKTAELKAKTAEFRERAFELRKFEVKNRNEAKGFWKALDPIDSRMRANESGKRLLSYWLRTAPKEVLKLSPEARELRVLLMELSGVDVMVARLKKHTSEGLSMDHHRWFAVQRIRGLQQAHDLLANGAPAKLIRDYLIALRDDPNAEPPTLLPGDRMPPPKSKDLGISPKTLSVALSAITAGLKFRLDAGQREPS